MFRELDTLTKTVLGTLAAGLILLTYLATTWLIQARKDRLIGLNRVAQVIAFIFSLLLILLVLFWFAAQ